MALQSTAREHIPSHKYLLFAVFPVLVSVIGSIKAELIRQSIRSAEPPLRQESSVPGIIIFGQGQPSSRLSVVTGHRNRNRGQKVKIVKSSFTGKTIRLNNEAEFKAITRLMDLSNTGNITAYKDLIDSNNINPRFSLIFKELGLNDPRNARELVIIE